MQSQHPPSPLHKGETNYKTTQPLNHSTTMNKKELIQKILNILITVLTAVATTFGVTSCIGV